MLASEMPQAMSNLADRFENEPIQEGMDEVRKLAHQSVRDAFTSSASPAGEDWPPRKHVGDGHPLLIDTGRLLQSSVGTGEGRVLEVTGREFNIGSNVKYASYHQHGTSKLPKRPYMGMSEKHQADGEEVIADAVMEKVFDG